MAMLLFLKQPNNMHDILQLDSFRLYLRKGND